MCRLRKKLNILWHKIFVCNVLIIFFQSETNEIEASKDLKSLPFIRVEKEKLFSAENVCSQRPFSSELLIIKRIFAFEVMSVAAEHFERFIIIKKGRSFL